jgi:hypothetical protein
MSKEEAGRQIERVKFIRELTAIEREHIDHLESRLDEMEVEALEALSEEWVKEHGGAA